MLENGGTLLSEAHDFLHDLRSAWVSDPDANPVQLVCRRKPAVRRSKPVKLSGTEQVVQFLEQLEHPLKPEIEEVRMLILNSGDQITEHIKWKAPSFCYNNEDRITFNLQGHDRFRLIFHTGAKAKEIQAEGPLLQDPAGLLEWITGDRAVISIKDREDLESKRELLAHTVSRWFTETAHITF